MAGSEVRFNKEKSFLCIDYPLLVKNKDRMLQSLGGIEGLSKVFGDSTLRLGLKFRQEDAYCKPAYGDRVNSTRLLLKVVRRRKKTDPPSCSTYHSEFLGIINHTYRFTTMADYQYLPMERKSEEKYVSIVDQLVPQKLELSSWLEGPAPLFMHPIIFSRIDNPTDYHFRKDPKNRERTMPASLHNDVITRTRIKRCGYTTFVSFDDEHVPQKASEEVDLTLRTRSDPNSVELVKSLFDQIPIWTRKGVMVQSGCNHPQIKCILPLFAYYFVNGPWRTLWVRYGYDPRKDPKSKIWQTLDCRFKMIGSTVDPSTPSTSKRQSFNVKYVKWLPQFQAKTPIIKKDSLSSSQETNQAEVVEGANGQALESLYVFREDVIPPSKQMFYQLCHVYVEEVQQMVHSNDGQETKLTEKDGWCKPDTLAKCRRILTDHLSNLLGVVNRGTELEDKVESELELSAEMQEEITDDSEEELDISMTSK